MADEFDIYSIKNKNILIKTFLFESGLWYLAKSLGDILSKHNNVYYIPKARYTEDGGRFIRTYPSFRDKDEISECKLEFFNENKKTDTQIFKCIEKYNADLIISFETLMEAGQWVINCRQKYHIDVYDVPMSEWVTKRFVDSDSYLIFDKILCLTDVVKGIFSKYDNSKLVSWDYVDLKYINEGNARKDDIIKFYHPASTNANCTMKNTSEVIDAFIKFSKISKRNGDNVSLVITGILSNKDSHKASKCNDILIIDNYIDRQGVFDIYGESHCVILPSKKEGLGLSFYEAKACGCSIITTDYPPMNNHTDYCCSVVNEISDGSLVPLAITNSESILKELNKYYEDFIMAKKTRVTTKEVEVKPKRRNKKEVEAENKELLSAFSAGLEANTEVGLEKVLAAEEVAAEIEAVEARMNEQTLEKLKKKMNNKDEVSNMPVLVDKKTVSINMAVIGVGQAGSRIAEEFHTRGYDVGVVNTSAQDLEYINVTPQQKLLIEGSLGGTGKDLDLGRDLFDENSDLVFDFVKEVADGNDMVYLAISGGGGTGASSVDLLIPMMFNLGMPVGVIFVLPKATEDAQSKRNSIETLARLAKMTSDSLVSNLIVVDNARIEQIYANLSQSQFWGTANTAIVEPLHLFNALTATPSEHTSMDPSDFGKIISCGDCSIYGVIEVEDYMEETALAEAVIDSLSTSMLAEGFDVSQTRVGGVIVTGSKSALDRIPAVNINYCFHMISEQTSGAAIFQGIYSTDSDDDTIKIYSWFAGLGLPQDRVESLKRESAIQSELAAEKEKNRVSAMNLDLGEDRVNSVTEEVNRKIRKKKSGFSRLQRGARKSIIDKRRKR